MKIVNKYDIPELQKYLNTEFVDYGNTQSGFAANFPFKPVNQLPDTLTSLLNFQDDYYLPNQQPVTSLGFDTSYGVANEPDVPQVPLSNTGIPFATKAKNFITQTLPNMIKGGINMIPGIGMIQRLDKFNTLPYQDRQFIKSAMDMKGIPDSGIYVDPRTGLIKDIRGKNVRSLMGNYAKSIEEDYSKLENQLEKSKSNWTDKFGSLENTNQFGKTWSEMNKNNLSNFNFLQSMKNKFDQQKAELREKIKQTPSVNIHADDYGGEGPKGGGPDYSNVSTGGGGSPAQQAASATRSRDLRGGPGKNYGPYG
jgi:hypothetical protein